MSDAIEHEGTDEVVCPHCGYKEESSYERMESAPTNSGTDTCGECGKDFTWDADFEVTYNTQKIEAKDGEMSDEMKMDAEYFLKKFEAIPEEKWCVGQFTDGEACDALGHCGIRAESFNTKWGNQEADALQCLIGMYGGVGPINDGAHDDYKQATPKQRVLAALLDAKMKEGK